MKKALLMITDELAAVLVHVAGEYGQHVNELIEERLRADRYVKAGAEALGITFPVRGRRGRPPRQKADE